MIEKSRNFHTVWHVLKIEAVSKYLKLKTTEETFLKISQDWEEIWTHPNKVNDVFSLLDVHLCDAPTRSRYVHYVGLEGEELFFLFLFLCWLAVISRVHRVGGLCVGHLGALLTCFYDPAMASVYRLVV